QGRASPVSAGKHLSGVEERVEDRDVSAQEHVRNGRLGHLVRGLAFESGLLARPNVGIGPAVERALLDRGEVVGDEVVADPVMLLASYLKRLSEVGSPTYRYSFHRARPKGRVSPSMIFFLPSALPS